MPYPNWHAARMVSPDAFDRFANKTIADGIEVILGMKKGETGSTIQAYRFSVGKFTAEEARKWLKDHNLKPILFEAAAGKTTQSFITLSSRGIQALRGIDILSLVPADIMAAIKARDSHPFLQAYSICHEGISTPTLLGDTSRPIRWTRAAVQSIKNMVLRGVKFFLGHNADNSTEGREPLGEIVWDGQTEIDGTLHHIVVGHFPDKTKVSDKDICSQEAEWDFFESAGAWFAGALHKLTGIALSSSKTDKPAFEGARRLGMVQALEDGERGFDPAAHGYVDSSRRKTGMSDLDLTTVPFGALVQEMKRRDTFPSQIFTVEDLKKDHALAGVFAENETLKKQVADKDGEVKKLNDAKVAGDKALQTTTAKERFTAMVDKMTLTPKQKAFVTKSYPAKMDDVSDEGLKRFVDEKLEDFKVAAQTFDIKEELPAQGAGDKGAAGGSDDLSKAANNPLLEADLDLT